jgi:Fe-S-cluster-containing dehydrogenase component
MYVIREKSIIVSIDTGKCDTCASKACIEACRRYARGMLVPGRDGAPSADHLSPEETLRLGTECLACEYACNRQGRGAIAIEAPIEGFADYWRKTIRE